MMSLPEIIGLRHQKCSHFAPIFQLTWQWSSFFFCFLLKIGSVGFVEQEINLTWPYCSTEDLKIPYNHASAITLM